MSFTVIIGALELGVIYAIMSLGVFLSYRTLNTPDLTVDGSFMLGAAASAVLCSAGHPVLGILAAIVLGMLAGCVTSLLNTKLKIATILASILVMLGLYSINLRVMGGKANITLTNAETVYTSQAFSWLGQYSKLAISLVFLIAVIFLLYFFLTTRFGLALRATGDNENMVRANGINTDITKLIGLALSNGLTGLSGALIAQYQKFSDINMSTGMVIIGLSCVIIGEVVFGTRHLVRRLCAVALGSILYRLIIAFVLQMGMPPTDLKLISAVIVAIALSASKFGNLFSKFKKREN